jgi:hypothetical protein
MKRSLFAARHSEAWAAPLSSPMDELDAGDGEFP